MEYKRIPCKTQQTEMTIMIRYLKICFVLVANAADFMPKHINIWKTRYTN